MAVKLSFGILGAMAYQEQANLFDDLFFSKSTPFVVLVATFIFTGKKPAINLNFSLVIVVLPVVVRSQLMAKYFIWIGGMCDVPSNYFTGIVLPWVIGAVINHLQLYAYLVNWTALITCFYTQFVCPMFMWSMSIKEAKIYEDNFKQSLQMIFEGERPAKEKLSEIYLPSPEKTKSRARSKKSDEIGSIDFSASLTKYKGLSTSKYLLNDDEERVSSISDIFDPADEKKFI